MKPLFIFIIIFSMHEMYAQTLPSFKTLRYEEDYSFLRYDTTSTAYKNLKYIPVSKGSSYVSFGSDIRYQYFNIRNEDWGSAPKDENGFALSRFLFHTDAHASRNFRAFVQLQASMANNKASGTSAVDENPLDLHQAFVDVQTNSKNLIFRIGRQELSYGSQRLVAVRELPNNRQSFDAANLLFRSGDYRADIFYSRYVVAKKELFDDVSNKNISLWGSYIVIRNLSSLFHSDIYYLGLKRKNAVFEDGSGHEQRHSFGIRLWGEKEKLRYDVEAVYQTGKFEGKKIRAYTISSNAGYRFTSLPLQPELELKTEIISGDKEKGDGHLQTFNPLFPKGAYFGLAALIGPANLFDIHPSLSMNLWKEKLLWSIDHDVFWRYSEEDGIYGPNVALLYPAGNNAGRFIGHQLSTDVTYTPNPFLLLRTEGTWFAPGDYLKAVSPGKQILLFGVTMQLKF